MRADYSPYHFCFSSLQTVVRGQRFLAVCAFIGHNLCREPSKGFSYRMKIMECRFDLFSKSMVGQVEATDANGQGYGVVLLAVITTGKSELYTSREMAHEH
jgi:hypothetical protein